MQSRAFGMPWKKPAKGTVLRYCLFPFAAMISSKRAQQGDMGKGKGRSRVVHNVDPEYFPTAALASSRALPHLSCVRGSPLFRTFLILVVIAASGFLFVRMTAAPKAEVRDVPVHDSVATAEDAIVAKVYLTLSGKPIMADVQGTGLWMALEETATGTFTGEVVIDGESPLLSVRVDWLEKGESHRFAKLVVEAPGKKTFTRVFDAPGDIDDFVELPF